MGVETVDIVFDMREHNRIIGPGAFRRLVASDETPLRNRPCECRHGSVNDIPCAVYTMAVVDGQPSIFGRVEKDVGMDKPNSAKELPPVSVPALADGVKRTVVVKEGLDDLGLIFVYVFIENAKGGCHMIRTTFHLERTKIGEVDEFLNLDVETSGDSNAVLLSKRINEPSAAVSLEDVEFEFDFDEKIVKRWRVDEKEKECGVSWSKQWRASTRCGGSTSADTRRNKSERK